MAKEPGEPVLGRQGAGSEAGRVRVNAAEQGVLAPALGTARASHPGSRNPSAASLLSLSHHLLFFYSGLLPFATFLLLLPSVPVRPCIGRGSVSSVKSGRATPWPGSGRSRGR